MPEFISLRSFRLETTLGHIVQFERSVPKFIPEVVVPFAMAAGCVPVDSADIPFYDDKARTTVEFNGDIRRSLIYIAVKHCVTKNDSKDFDGSGVPKASVLTTRLGFEVGRKEAVDVFQQYTTLKNEGRDFDYDSKALNVMRVIEAEDRAELMEIAEEFGIEERTRKGLQVRELRKLLLTKLSGVAIG